MKMMCSCPFRILFQQAENVLKYIISFQFGNFVVIHHHSDKHISYGK